MQLALLIGLLATAPPGPARPGPAAEARSARPRAPPGKPAVTGVLNVNRASEAELRLLRGIGRGRAHAIAERRSKRPFASLEELARMKGMKGVVQKLRPHLVVQGDTTLRPLPHQPGARRP
ncbi:MAG: ComEA family DNA-binding protein [Myxococcales bacterium]